VVFLWVFSLDMTLGLIIMTVVLFNFSFNVNYLLNNLVDLDHKSRPIEDTFCGGN